MDQFKPLVSVITPSYQQGSFLEETIISVFDQNYSNIEYIIIDGGSTDQSIEIIKKHEDRIQYWVTEKDNGQADAINKGLKVAKGDFVCWINSDDILYPDFISTRVKQFQKNPEVDFIYGDVDQGVDMHHRRLRKGRETDFFKMLTSLNVPVPQQSTIWRRSVMEKIGYLDEKWHVLLDREYFMRIARYCKIRYMPGSVAYFRNHSESKSVKEELKWADEIIELYHEILNLDSFNVSDFLTPVNQKKIEIEVLFFTSSILRRHGQISNAIKLEAKAKKISFLMYCLKKLDQKSFFSVAKKKYFSFSR